VNETHQLPCLKRKLFHSALLCILSADEKQIRQTHHMELLIVTYQGGVVLVMSAYFCPHSVFNSGYLIEFMCLKSDLIDNSNN